MHRRNQGKWVMRQRVHFKYKQDGKKSKLSEDKIKKLNDIGFAWVAPGFKGRKRQRTNDGAGKSATSSGEEGNDDDDDDDDDAGFGEDC